MVNTTPISNRRRAPLEYMLVFDGTVKEVYGKPLPHPRRNGWHPPRSAKELCPIRSRFIFVPYLHEEWQSEVASRSPSVNLLPGSNFLVQQVLTTPNNDHLKPGTISCSLRLFNPDPSPAPAGLV